MKKLHRVPSVKEYMWYIGLLAAVCALFPMALCFDFGQSAINNRPVPFGACALSYTTRLGQVAPLIGFVGALVALFPIRQARLVKHNKRYGPQVISGLERLVKQANANSQRSKARTLGLKLKRYRRYYQNAKDFKELEEGIVKIGIAIALVATVLSVMAAGA